MSPSVWKALTILRDADEPLSALEFAERMWPDSPGWTVTMNVGARGASQGSGMARAANGMLGKLRKSDLVIRDYKDGRNVFRVSAAGRRALREAS